MKIDFGKISDEEGKEFLADKVKLSLYVAKIFLEKIPSNCPNKSGARTEFEILVEGYLLFIISARDGMLQQINRKLEFPLQENKVKLNDEFKEKLLSDKNLKFKDIWNLIQNCTQEPEKIVLGNNPEFWEWDRTKSWLWEINKMRNHIAHNSITGQNIVAFAGGGINTKMRICTLSKKPMIRIKNRTCTVLIKNVKEEEIKEIDPRKYFTECYENFVCLKNKINELLL